MQANRCSFILAVFSCDVCCKETTPQLYFEYKTFAATQKDNSEKKRNRNSFSFASFQPHDKAWPVSPGGGLGIFSNYFLVQKSLLQAKQALLNSVSHAFATSTKYCQSEQEPESLPVIKFFLK